MADINRYIQNILDAVYGETVRNSIAIAIREMNLQINDADTRMSEFIGFNMDTTLTDTSKPAQGKAVGDAIAQTFVARGSLDNGDDLDDLFEKGYYFIKDTASNIGHSPEPGVSGRRVIFVLSGTGTTADNTFRHMIYYNYNTLFMAIRWHNLGSGTTWSEWKSAYLESDDLLTSSVKMAQSKAVGDSLTGICEGFIKTHEPYVYRPIHWRRGRLETDGANIGQEINLTNALHDVRYISEFIDAKSIDGIQITRLTEVYISIAFFKYDSSFNCIERQKYDTSNAYDVDIISTPKDCAYLRLSLWPSVDSTAKTTDFVNLDTIGTHCVGLSARNSFEYDGDINKIRYFIPFGRGAIVDGVENYSNSYIRLRTPYLKTSDIDRIVFDVTNKSYRVYVFYYNQEGSASSLALTGSNSSHDVKAWPVIKDYPYFRLCVYKADVAVSDFTPWNIMDDFRFYKDLSGPAGDIEEYNAGLLASYGVCRELYPKYWHRRRYISGANVGQLRPVSDTIDIGCSRISTKNFISVDEFDFILNEKFNSGMSLWITVFDSNGAYLGYKQYTGTETVSCSQIKNIKTGTCYITVGIIPDNSSYTTVFSDQYMYRYIHICKKLASSEEKDTSIISLNSDPDLLVKLQNLRYYYNSPSNDGFHPLVLLHFSDLHSNETPLIRIVEFMNEYSDYIDDAIHTGDIVNNANETFSFADVHGAEKILNCIGNHDTYDGTNWYGLSESDAYTKYFADCISNWNAISQTGKCYYYKDYVLNKEYSGSETATVRLIVLDNLHERDSSDTTQPNLLQLTWFQNTLSDSLSRNIPVIVANHTRMATGSGLEYLDSGFMNPHANIQTSSAPFPIRTRDEYRNAVKDFVTAGGEIICWICGHNHSDILATWNFDYIKDGSTVTAKILNIAITTAGNFGRVRTKEPRIADTKSYDAFNLMGIDINRKELKLVRIGLNYNSAMRKIDTACWNYETGTLISTS